MRESEERKGKRGGEKGIGRAVVLGKATAGAMVVLLPAHLLVRSAVVDKLCGGACAPLPRSAYYTWTAWQSTVVLLE